MADRLMEVVRRNADPIWKTGGCGFQVAVSDGPGVDDAVVGADMHLQGEEDFALIERAGP